MTRDPAGDDGPGVSRRDYLLGAGMVGLTAVAGCVGLGGRSDDITTALLSGTVVVLAADAEEPTLVDPAETTTPVGDAVGTLGEAGGTVCLPPGRVRDEGPIRLRSNTAIVGFGPDVSEVDITTPDTDGLVFADPEGLDRVLLDQFALNGPGLDTDSGVALHHREGDTQELIVGHLLLWGWNNAVYRVDQNVGPFQCRHRQLTVYECDAGAEDGLLDFGSYYGPANWFGTVAVYPRSGHSGTDSTVLFTRGGSQRIEYLTMGGTAGTAVRQTGDANLRVDHVHWEPHEAETVPPAIVDLAGGRPAHVGTLKHVTGTAAFAYRIGADEFGGTDPAQKFLGPYDPAGESPALTRTVVELAAPGDPARPSFYLGTAEDVTVTHDADGVGGLRALGDAGTGL
ncbi:hypothetical protein ACFQL1_08305 [Halomicroarcula sp. GCM10025709]|uniref:hypothetical protein n=1 Tax=Haloarcula TaxID=2237 RepID=UPI0024C2EB79|nr:hypothetical protein [Halomicroarcula sp. YJ-61-S]